MADRPDPAKELVDQARAAAEQFAAAMAPLADAYLAGCARASATMAAWAAEVARALAASHGQRGERGDPTGDPPLRRGDG
jgi:hypothetical protein